MMNIKIQANHLERKAVIYVRQSSAYQVQNHKESQQRQYALQERAIKLGWQKDQVTVIDEDLGISGAHSENRPGYQKLISLIALKKVGVIFGIEVSRLARNCLDWYELLEIASTYNTLIADEDAIFNPADYNDRLLLGLKGTISEAELYQIKNRMMRGRMNKAQRGALEIHPPVGYEWVHGKMVKTPDESVRTAIINVFSLFQQINSIRGVLLELRRRQQELPYEKITPGVGRCIAWKKPAYESIYLIISNPTYAGVYTYGRRKKDYNPVSKKTNTRTIGYDDIEVLIPDHHEGYITYEAFKANVATLMNNHYKNTMGQGAVREGYALLQGIVYCKRCGLKMRPRYTQKRYYYCCDRDHRRFGEPICGWASARRVDNAVIDMMLEVINEGTVDLTFQLMKRHQEEQEVLYRQWSQKIKRLDYEANLARKRYESVDPENRLVVSTLESEWNEKLMAIQQAKAEYEKYYPKGEQSSLTVSEIKALLKTLKQKWETEAITIQDKKEITRCLIEKVFITTKGKVLIVEINWHGQTITKLEVPKYLFSSSHLYHRIQALALAYTDSEIASRLNEEGLLTVKGKPWSPRRVMDFRLSNHIPSGFTRAAEFSTAQGYVPSQEAAQALNANIVTIQKWFKVGILEGRRGIGKQSKLWIYLNEEIIKRLNGTAEFDTTIKTFRSVIKEMSLSRQALVEWVKLNNHEIIRLKRGNAFHFYIKPKNSQ